MKNLISALLLVLTVSMITISCTPDNATEADEVQTDKPKVHRPGQAT